MPAPRVKAIRAPSGDQTGWSSKPRDRLIDELWRGKPPASAVNVLQTYVWHLRRVLPAGVLETRPTGYVLRLEPDQLDLHRFERLLDEAGRALADGRARDAACFSRE